MGLSQFFVLIEALRMSYGNSKTEIIIRSEWCRCRRYGAGEFISNKEMKIGNSSLVVEFTDF